MLVRAVAPFVVPTVQAVVPEQVPASVVTRKEGRSNLLMALFSRSAISAYVVSGWMAIALGHLKPELVPQPSILPAVVDPATTLLALDDRITLWTRLFAQSGTNAYEPSGERVTWPTFNILEPNVMVVTALVATSILLKLPALFWAIRANTGI